MSRNASGTHSLPAGNPVVTGTAISSTVHNATQTDFSTEITDSLSRSGKGGMLAPLRNVDGSVSAPAVSFTSETGTGFYRAGANDVRMAVAGADKYQQTATTATFTGGTNGAGVTATGGATNSAGVVGTGAGTGAGVSGTGGATGPGVIATAGGAGSPTTGSLRLTSQATPSSAASGDVYHLTSGLWFMKGTTPFNLTPTDTTSTPSTGWTLDVNEATRVAGVITVSIAATAGASAAWTTIATLSGGYRPTADLTFPCLVIDAGTATYSGMAQITTAGVVLLTHYDNGASLIAPFTIGAGDIIQVHASFRAA